MLTFTSFSIGYSLPSIPSQLLEKKKKTQKKAISFGFLLLRPEGQSHPGLPVSLSEMQQLQPHPRPIDLESIPNKIPR